MPEPISDFRGLVYIYELKECIHLKCKRESLKTRASTTCDDGAMGGVIDTRLPSFFDYMRNASKYPLILFDISVKVLFL